MARENARCGTAVAVRELTSCERLPFTCGSVQVGRSDRPRGNPVRLLEQAQSGAAPATVSGEPSSRMPLGCQAREGGAKARTREPGDLPVPVTLPACGARAWGGFPQR